MDIADFPKPEGLSEEWLEIIGFRLLEKAAEGMAGQLRDNVFKWARPALRMEEVATDDNNIRIGASKIGGLPDLPTNFTWPSGRDCVASYEGGLGEQERLAGFIAQVNFKEIAQSQATRDLPASGLLSFFCFQDIPNDNRYAIGVRAVFSQGSSKLTRTTPSAVLSQGNLTMKSRRLKFEETLDMPHLRSDIGRSLERFHQLNSDNILGYAHPRTREDPPIPSVTDRHLIVLTNSYGCRLHIQIHQDELAKLNFDAIQLVWVDFD
ncbi:MAG: DUF1963 domain-containing protein [Fimbriiglobus sp.]